MKVSSDYKQLIAYPLDCATDFQDQSLQLRVEDDEPIGNSYSTTMQVINTPPKFDYYNPADQILGLNK